MPPQIQEIAVNTLPFWSRFTLTLDLRFDPPTGLVKTQFPAGFSIPVFDYRKGEQNVSALEASRATARDTILVQANQTRGGGAFKIFGLSLTKDGWPYVRSGDGNKNGIIHTLEPPNSMQPGNGGFGPQVLSVEDYRALDALCVQALLKYFRTEIRIDGTRRILEMGPTILYPGIGGPHGGNVDTTNGGTAVHNYMRIKEGVTWNPAGAVDSNLQVFLESAYDCLTPTWTQPTGLDDDGDPVADANPTAMGRKWTTGWIVNFHGHEESPTSNVS